jgi:hypothetical protein
VRLGKRNIIPLGRVVQTRIAKVLQNVLEAFKEAGHVSGPDAVFELLTEVALRSKRSLVKEGYATKEDTYDTREASLDGLPDLARLRLVE